MGIGNNIKNILKSRSMSVTELANIARINRGILYEAIKRDSNYIRTENLEKIAAALNVSVAELRDDSSDKPTDEQKEKLINNYYKLNEQGKNKLVERSEELAELSKYTR